MSDTEHTAVVHGRRRLPQRVFTDAELRACSEQSMTIAQAAKLLGAQATTITFHAKRLGLALHKPARRVWSAENDALVQQVADGDVAFRAACRMLSIGREGLHARAKTLGLCIQPFKPRCGTLVAEGPMHHDRGDRVLDVGECDQLLRRLREVHGVPRNEISPGSDRRARPLKPALPW